MHWSKGKKLLVRSLCVLTASSLMAAPAYAASATSITRLDGNTRYETMGRVVQTAFPKQSDYAVLASGDNFPDALAASSLAGALKAPIILTSSTTLSSEARNELQRLEARTVAIVGGSSAVSTAVENQVSQIVSDGTVVRFSGETRIETALSIYRNAPRQLPVTWSRTGIVTTSSNFADALSISPYAYSTASPIFLTDKNGLEPDVQQSLSHFDFDKAIIVGGSAVVPNIVEIQLSNQQLSTTRLSGNTRYDTSNQVGRFILNESVYTPSDIVFTTGENFPDALAGSALAGTRNTILLLAGNKYSPTIPFAEQNISYPQNIYVLGGKNAFTSPTINFISLRYGHGEIEPDPSEYVNESGVTPGAWCKKRDRGKKALSKHGTMMICSADPEDPDTYRWREYTGW